MGLILVFINQALNITKQLPKIAIVASIILLVGFLFYFLSNEYKREKLRIDREVGYMFINAVKNVEGNFFNKLIFSGDSIHRFKIDLGKNKEHKDSAKVVAFVGKHATHIDSSTRRMSIKIEDETFSQQEVSGVLSMIVDLNIDSVKNEIRQNKKDTIKDISKEYIPMITKEFKKSLEKANLNIPYQILNDSILSSIHKEHIVASYADIGTHKKFYVSLENNTFFILRNIWRPIALSLGLLSLIIVAFYTIDSFWKDQQKLSIQKNDFIQNMAHELKTPIATMSVALEAITNFDAANDELKRREYIEIARNETKRIALLVDKVLSLSALDESDQAILLEAVNLDETILEIVALQNVIENPIPISYVNYYREIKAMVDKEWIQIAIQNIVDNATKYHKGKDGHVSIMIEAKDENFLTILIKDNNEPIPLDAREKIFDKFYRLPQGNVHNVKGHGLGLYYVKRMMQLMQGSVGLTSNGNGNTFILKCRIAK